MTSPTTTFLFVYGTLQFEPVLSAVLGRSSTLILTNAIPGRLRHYTRYKVRNRRYPAIVPSEGSNNNVQGLLLEGFTELEWKKLDEFEGDEYVKQQVLVQKNTDGNIVQAFTYVWASTVTSLLSSSQLEDRDWNQPIDFPTEIMKEMVGIWTMST
jgi:gamma-glutamylcyclotransferase (GGCT)/AIG2-like uncharacterized protein YtfP